MARSEGLLTVAEGMLSWRALVRARYVVGSIKKAQLGVGLCEESDACKVFAGQTEFLTTCIAAGTWISFNISSWNEKTGMPQPVTRCLSARSSQLILRQLAGSLRGCCGYADMNHLDQVQQFGTRNLLGFFSFYPYLECPHIKSEFFQVKR